LRYSAEEANRLKDEFLATISHELRNPLSVIVGYSDLLLRDEQVKASPHLAHLSTVLRRNAMAQAHLIRDLLELSRLRSGKLTLNCEPVSIITAIDNAIDTVRADAARKRTSIDIHRPEQPLVIKGDLLRLEQIFWNLLSNSIKFTPPGGRVQVRLSRRSSSAVVVVEDNGEGIDPEFLPHVFEMFRQGNAASNRRHPGLGIGLALVRQLVELHNGSVHAYSEGAGKGTRFVIEFPEQPFPTEIPVTVQDDSTRDLMKRTVLAVDDHQDTVEMIKKQLEDRGATVLTATTGQAALQIAS
jgi:signal transduction histidine kinase